MKTVLHERPVAVRIPMIEFGTRRTELQQAVPCNCGLKKELGTAAGTEWAASVVTAAVRFFPGGCMAG